MSDVRKSIVKGAFCSILRPHQQEPSMNSGELITEKGGVLTLSERVRVAQIAGYRAEIQRYNMLYDTDIGTGEITDIPVARRPGYDIVDAYNDLQAVRERVRAQQQKSYDERLKKAKEDADVAYKAAIDREVEARLKSSKRGDDPAKV